MKILISGGTGLIGTSLIENLLKSGNEITVLTRNVSNRINTENLQFMKLDSNSVDSLKSIISEFDAVINLAGESIGSGFWTKNKKERIVNSRVEIGKILANAIIDSDQKPDVFIQASGVGYYGTSTSAVFDESSPNGTDFLASVAKVWEASSEELDTVGVRRVIIRTGVVLDKNSGALPLMVLPFRLFVGGPLGNGKQVISWIHLEDEVRAIEFLLTNKDISGPVNLTSPGVVTNKEFGKIIGEVLRKPFWFPTPSFGLKLLLGEKSTLVLDGQNAPPNKLIAAGFKFMYPALEGALSKIYKS